MHPINLLHLTPDDGIRLKNQLIAAGLKQGEDFVWAYRQANYNNDGYEAVTPRTVTFEFADHKLATFYKLKWSNAQT